MTENNSDFPMIYNINLIKEKNNSSEPDETLGNSQVISIGHLFDRIFNEVFESESILPQPEADLQPETCLLGPQTISLYIIWKTDPHPYIMRVIDKLMEHLPNYRVQSLRTMSTVPDSMSLTNSTIANIFKTVNRLFLNPKIKEAMFVWDEKTMAFKERLPQQKKNRKSSRRNKTRFTQESSESDCKNEDGIVANSNPSKNGHISESENEQIFAEIDGKINYDDNRIPRISLYNSKIEMEISFLLNFDIFYQSLLIHSEFQNSCLEKGFSSINKIEENNQSEKIIQMIHFFQNDPKNYLKLLIDFINFKQDYISFTTKSPSIEMHEELEKGANIKYDNTSINEKINETGIEGTEEPTKYKNESDNDKNKIPLNVSPLFQALKIHYELLGIESVGIKFIPKPNHGGFDIVAKYKLNTTWEVMNPYLYEILFHHFQNRLKKNIASNCWLLVSSLRIKKDRLYG